MISRFQFASLAWFRRPDERAKALLGVFDHLSEEPFVSALIGARFIRAASEQVIRDLVTVMRPPVDHMVVTRPCPECGLKITIDRRTKTITHEDPTCDEFVRRMLAFGVRVEVMS